MSRLYDGQCVPFLGAGVNVAGPDYVGLPLGSKVALRLANDLITTDVKTFEDLAHVQVVNDALAAYPHLLRLQLQNLASVAFHLSRAVDPPHVIQIVEGLLADENSEPSKLLQTLARLPHIPLIVTTNYDLLMERALKDAKREFVKIVQPVAGFKPDELAQKDLELADAKASKTLILYKIHGSFADPERPDAPRQIVLTEEDYIQFLTVVANDEIGIPPTIKAEMTSGTLLFLGYSLEDWDFRTLFKGTIEKLERYEWFKSFAIQWEPPEFWADFWADEKKVVVYDVDLHAFADDLAQKYDAYAQNKQQGDDD